MFVGKTIPLKFVLALSVSCLAAGAHAQVCELTADGSACGPLECSDIPEEQCLATVLHVDMATGAITPLACECIDYSYCHIEFGNASPFAVGGCPDGTPCVVVASDSDGDGIDDEFTAVCRPGDVGACCFDIDDGPIPYDTCVELTAEACDAGGGVFDGVNSWCGDREACCMREPFCAEMYPFCCIASGGVPRGPTSSCAGATACGQQCGGIASIPCENEGDYCRFPFGCLCCDLMGVCLPIPTECPAIWPQVCGCDGVTYENECTAAAAGISVNHLGPCEDRPCGGLGPYPPCEPDEFCDVPPGTCGDPSVIGVCRPIPSECPTVWDPVCGCNGVTYGNACEAHAAGVSIAHPGECEQGACCFSDQPQFPPCLVDTEAVCAELGGEFQGGGTACPPDPAQPCGPGKGACCLDDPNGTVFCVEATEEGCADQGGRFLGQGSLCPSDGTIPCEPTGACCLADAGVLVCVETTVLSCLLGGGEYHGDGSRCPPAGDPPCPVVGACCLPDGMCIELVWEVCLAEGGLPHPGGAPCDPVICGGPPTGACCYLVPGDPISHCIETTEAECAPTGGVYFGDGTTCPTDASTPCGPSVGACCLPDGTCIEVTWDECIAEGGEPHPTGQVCEAVLCGGPATGACCYAVPGDPNHRCVVTTEAECPPSEGMYFGDGTTCPTDPADPCGLSGGACCLPDGMCLQATWDACLAEGGIPHPTGQQCYPDLCGDPGIGACCLPDAAGTPLCIEATEEGCADEGGKFLGPGTVCPPDGTTPCEAEAGACCFPDGDCQDLPADVCTAVGGDHLPGASCNIVDCPGDPVGACCILVPGSPDGLCTETTEAECVGQGGVYEGDWTSCADDGRCAQPTGACCVNDSTNNVMCFEGTEQQCFAQGGVFQGPGSACPSDPNVLCGTPCPAVCPPDYWCFSECGVLVAGVECILFQADSGGVFLVSNLGGFVVGDRVHVTGCATYSCVSICMQGNGCINDNVIGPCGEQVCGGIAGIPCDDPDSFCKYPMGTCGMYDIFGVCTPIPGGCFDPWEPVCGCDGVTYGDECEADAAGVSIAHPGACPVVCEPLDAGFGCVPNAACGLIPEDQCLVTAIGPDDAGAAFATVACECMDFNLCHFEYVPGGPVLPVGECPNGGTCDFVAHDTDGDGYDDLLTAECVPPEIGICCGDIGGSPLPVPVCVEVTPDACGGGGIFGGVGTTCDPAEACCMSPLGSIYCVDIHPFCCAAFGGIPQGPNSACVDVRPDEVCVPQVCGGIAGIQCDEGWFCDYRVGTCNIADRDGVCRLVPPGCPDVWEPVCSCDGVTYGNTCEAHMAGASIDHWGECGPACCDPREAPPCIEGPFCCGDGHWTCGDGGGGTNCEAPGEVCENICGGIAGIPCFGNDFCKFPEGTCGMYDIFGVCTPIPGGGCPENYDPVCGCNGTTYGNECEADAAGVSIAHRGECTVGECAATRTLSDPDDLAYCPGVTKRVHIALNPPAGTSAVGVEDAPPAGWVVSNISDGGTFDFVNWKVKWGPLFPPFPAELTYEVTPADVAGVECFTGTISIDGVNESICGDQCVDACCPHMRADVPRPECTACPVGDCESCGGSCGDGQVSMCELVGYACSWMTGCNDDLGGMTRAAYVWRNGECYCWDDAEQNWFPSACGDSSSTCCEGGHQGASGSGPSVGALWTAEAQLRPIRSRRIRGYKELQVPITIEAPEGTSAMALDCEVPRGWHVTGISDGGVWDELHRKVKWGPFMDNLSRTVSFKASKLRVALTAKSRRLRGERPLDGFAGTVSFDGVNHPLTIE